MAQAKKTAAASAKIASAVANKAAKHTYAAVESTRNSAENVVKISSRAAKDFLNQSAGEAQKAQDKILAMSREGAEQFAKSADAATKALYDVVGASRENMEAAVECGNTTASLVKELSTEIFEFANKSFTDSVELTKQAFTCRTINDMMDLQSRALKSAMDNAFSQTSRLSSMLFEYSTQAFEPINERITETAEKLGKTILAA